MEKNYWLEKWRDGDTRFHEPKVHDALRKFFPKDPPGKVLVPLCGKSSDMVWLMDQGHEVVGAELSPIACQDFFKENNIPFEQTKQGNFSVFTGEKIQLWCGDFFELPEGATQGMTAIYDRAALVALPDDIRLRYANHLKKLIKSSRDVFFLLITFEYPQDQVKGPPFSVLKDEVTRLFGDTFSATLLQQSDNSSLTKNPKFKDIKPVIESIYQLKKLLN